MKEILETNEYEKERNSFSEEKYYHNKNNGTEIDMIDLDDVFMAGSLYVLDRVPKWKKSDKQLNIGALFIDHRGLVLYTDKVQIGDLYISIADILKLDKEE